MRYLYLVGLVLVLIMTGCSSAINPTPARILEPTLPPEPVVCIHYLGHASFFLQFDNGISVLTDYGQSNAYSLNSPIYDLIGIEPGIVTFSHTHPDHKRPKAEFGQARILTDAGSLNLDGLEITPIRTSEASLYAADNTSYLFTYKGLRILHLADVQAYITAIGQDSVRQKVKQLYPEKYDILLMTIQGVSRFIPQAEAFIDMLQPVRVIPMHYWSPEYKADFLAYLKDRNQQAGKRYNIEEIDSADYALYAGNESEPIRIISLEPESLSRTK